MLNATAENLVTADPFWGSVFSEYRSDIIINFSPLYDDLIA